MPMMAFIGVRTSWLMLARNWLLAWLAASAASLAALSSCSVCFCRRISTTKQMHSLPPRSSIVTPISTGTRRPSLWMYSFSHGWQVPVALSCSIARSSPARWSAGVSASQRSLPASQVVARIADDAQERVVGVEDAAVEIGHQHADQARLHELAEAGVALRAASSARIRSVTSQNMPCTPTICPRASRTGALSTCTCSFSPDLLDIGLDVLQRLARFHHMHDRRGDISGTCSGGKKSASLLPTISRSGLPIVSQNRWLPSTKRPCEVLAKHIQRQALDQRLIDGLRFAAGLLGLFVLADAGA